MKLKTKAVFVAVLLPCGFILHLFLNLTQGDKSKLVKSEPPQEELIMNKLSNAGRISVRDNQECAPTRLSLCYSDFTSFSLMDELRFNVSDSGTYSIQLSKQAKENVAKRIAIYNKAQKLNIIVIPHSQNDPGRLKPFHKLYYEKSKQILNLIIEKLNKYKTMRFIWADISFLSFWWNQQSKTNQQKFQALVKNGQLEIVNGGWVIPDEACTQYYDVIQQLIEGHQWVYNTLGVKPRVNWAVDPAGHSETMPYLWKLAGFDYMVIARVHAALKSYLRLQQKLEFTWRQFWDPGDHTDIPCHVLPYASPNTMDTCGPDSSICKTFDFAQSPPVPKHMRSDDDNFIVLASALYEQYQTTAKAFAHNTIFVPIGGEFRWETASEWDKHYHSYTKLFDYMNKRKDWNVSVKFGTLSDYFQTRNASVFHNPKMPKTSSLQVFSGNFLPYSDRGNEYWTGYYSSRAWLKFIGREVESALRTANMLHALACARIQYDTGLMEKCRFQGNNLNVRRKELSLYQHHEVITGTSRPDVVEDYVKRLTKIFHTAHAVAEWAVPTLLLEDISNYGQAFPIGSVPYGLSVRDKPRTSLRLTQLGRHVIFFNPLPIERVEAARLRVNDSNVIVSINGKTIPAQIVPVLNSSHVIYPSLFDVSFSVTIPPLGMETVLIRLAKKDEKANKTELSEVSVKKTANVCKKPCSFTVNSSPAFREIVVENDCLKLEFEGRTGLLKEVLDKTSNRRTTVDIDFLNYTPYKAGAYVFQARVEAESFMQSDKINVIVSRGRHVTTVQATHHLLRHTVKLHHMSGPHCRAIHIENLVQLGDTTDFEVIMRIRTDIMNHGEIYTDANAFQMIKRVRRNNLPLGANMFPMTSMAFIQNRARRMSLHSFQPLAVGSLVDGYVDVLLERAVKDDDHRGLGEGLSAGYPTPSKFYISLEETVGRPSDQKPYSLPSLFSYQLNDILQNPVYLMQYPHETLDYYKNTRTGLVNPLPCDFHIVSLRELPLYDKDLFNAAMIVHKRGYACGSSLETLNCTREWGGLKFNSLFSEFRITDVSEWKLSYIDKLKSLALNDTLKMSPMSIRAFHFRLG